MGEEVRARWSDKRLYLAKIMKITSEGKSTNGLCVCSVVDVQCGRCVVR